ncbi:hypothetical protein ONE63_008343 [Megalurothrips usitatus]|uniref:Fatty acyl-CoA reductase n=1 Tax=Megalurothrips usitatus TaxID=439358 RepID=A0AAV7XQ09_9NEOP|nr:hypothetical protein ONE63_008343 [Megalurothrips usitatus]
MASSETAVPAGIPEFFAGRDVLVTGATGFMGKVLLEKLLRCCPDIRTIYILVRPKKGVEPSKRLESVAKTVLFEGLLKQKPDAFRKVVPLEGQVHDVNMGLSEADQRLILERVSVVFHLAASLDWRASLKKAVTDNTIGTKRVMEFCSRIRNLASLVYTSTAFCQCEEDVLEERVYPARVDPAIVIELSEKLDEPTLEAIRPPLLGRHPNCYTFTKALTEHVVAEYSKTMPICMVRPAIVVPALREPLPGWVDSLNGPIGVLVASGKGVLRSMMCNEKYGAEVIPVDICINLIIAAVHKRAREPRLLPEMPVYNACTGSKDRTTWREVLEIGHKKIIKYPFEWSIWYPDGNIRTNWYTHTLIVFFFQTVPAYFVDFIFLCLFMERFMVRVQRKINSGNELLTFFTMREWVMDNDRGWSLWQGLTPRDQETFYVNNVLPADKDAYMDTAVFGARTYCMKEPVSSLKACRRRIKVQYVVHRACVALFYMGLVYLAVRLLELFTGDLAGFLPASLVPMRSAGTAPRAQ